MAYRLSSVVLAFLILVFAGCDSGDPINEPRPADVAGRYIIEELRFVPSASGLAAADVRARLNTGISSLDLSSGGNFLLRYQFTGQGEFFLSGDFDVRATNIRIRGRAADRPQYQRLLLENEFTLNRDPSNPRVLQSQIDQTVNLEAFDSDAYSGLQSVGGRLHIRLVREQQE